MRAIFLSFVAISLFACSEPTPKSEEKTPVVEAKAVAMVPTDMHGFTPGYSASFVMDSPKNTETVLALWQEWQSGDLSKSGAHFADSVSFFMADGSSMSGRTDSLLKGMQQYRSSYKSMDATIDAIFAVKSTDKDEDWVTLWGVEKTTNSKGKKDTVSLQETWRFNKAGKVDLMFQALRKGTLPPPPTK